MANTKFSDLAAATPEDADIVVGLKGGVAKSFLFSAIKTLVGAIVGSTGATDDALLAADGTGGKTAQAKSVTLSDTTGTFTNTTSDTGFTWVANGTGNHLFPTGRIIFGTADASGASLRQNGTGIDCISGDAGAFTLFRAGSLTLASWLTVTAPAAGTLSVEGGAGKLAFGGGRCLGLTSSTGDASTTEYPTSGDWGLHKNTTSGVTSIVRNDGGVIKTAALV